MKYLSNTQYRLSVQQMVDFVIIVVKIRKRKSSQYVLKISQLS